MRKRINYLNNSRLSIPVWSCQYFQSSLFGTQVYRVVKPPKKPFYFQTLNSSSIHNNIPPILFSSIGHLRSDLLKLPFCSDRCIYSATTGFNRPSK